MTWAFAALLRLYPRPFRRRFAAAMLEAFDEARAEARGLGGVTLVAFHLRTFADLVHQAVAERLRPVVCNAKGTPGRNGAPRRPRRRRAGSGAVGRRAAGLLGDVRLGVRMLTRHPGITAAAVATLTIGIGATTAIFAVLDTMVLRPPPFPAAQRIVQLWTWNRATGDGYPGVPAAERTLWAEQPGLFDAIHVFDGRERVLVGDGDPEQVSVVALSAGFLDLLGGQPALGRPFVAADAAADAADVAILADGLWRRRFGADPEIVGRYMQLDDTRYEIIGVMPRSFVFPDAGTDLYVPLPPDAPGVPVARLVAGLDVESGQARADIIADGLSRAGLLEAGAGIELFSLRDSFIYGVVGSARTTLWFLFGAVGLLLLIACANVAGLLLSQTLARQREIITRVALGAGRARIVRQQLVEGALLGMLGAACGTAVAFVAVRLATGLAPQRLTVLTSQPIAIDGRVLAFSFVVAMTTTLSFSALPAMYVCGARRLSAMSGERGATAGRGQRLLRSALVAGEVAVAAVLLAGAGLLVRSMAALLSVDPGFDTGVTVVTVTPSPGRYGEAAAQALLAERLEELGAGLPGVEVAAVTTGAPPYLSSLSSANRAEAEGQGPPEGVYRGEGPATRPLVEFLSVVSVSDDYFRVLGVPLLEGRPFGPADRDADVAIISEDFARRFWHGASPIGRRLRLRDNRPWLTVVGVVPDVRQTGLDDDVGGLEIYYPMAQSAPGYPRVYLLLRGDIRIDVLMPALRAGVAEIDRQLPIDKVETLADALYLDVVQQRFNTILLVTFAASALLLAAVGIYGVLAYSVTQRRREIGVRIALGARPGNVVRGVVADGMKMAVVGLALGGLGAWGLSRFMESLVFGVAVLDAPSLLGSAAVLIVVGLIASLRPSIRAARVDPMSALRGD